MDLGPSPYEERQDGHWPLGTTQEACPSSHRSRHQATDKEEASPEAKAQEQAHSYN